MARQKALVNAMTSTKMKPQDLAAKCGKSAAEVKRIATRIRCMRKKRKFLMLTLEDAQLFAEPLGVTVAALTTGNLTIKERKKIGGAPTDVTIDERGIAVKRRRIKLRQAMRKANIASFLAMARILLPTSATEKDVRAKARIISRPLERGSTSLLSHKVCAEIERALNLEEGAISGPLLKNESRTPRAAVEAERTVDTALRLPVSIPVLGIEQVLPIVVLNMGNGRFAVNLSIEVSATQVANMVAGNSFHKPLS